MILMTAVALILAILVMASTYRLIDSKYGKLKIAVPRDRTRPFP
jgi:ABC-type branched-subunit amino acid transport system permease subunit